MDQRKIDLMRQKMVDMGFWHNYTHIQTSFGVVAFVLADRCSLKDRKMFNISVAFTKEQLAEEDYVKYKINAIAEEYNIAMKPFGGFKRADVCISP